MKTLIKNVCHLLWGERHKERISRCKVKALQESEIRNSNRKANLPF